MNIAHEFRRYLRLLRSWAWLIVLGALVAGGVNYYMATKAPARYEANITLMVGRFIKQSTPDQMEVGLSDRLAVYYLELLRRQPVLEGVKQELQITNLSNEELASKVASRVVPSTAFIEISVVDLDPFRAVKLVNAFAHNLIKQSPTAPENQRQEQTEFVQKQLDDLQSKIESGRRNLQQLNQELTSGTTAAEITDTRGRIKALETQIDSWQTNYTNLLRLSNASSPNSINILEESNQSRRVKSLSPLISGAIAAVIGAFLALGCAIVLEYLDDRLKSPDDVRSRLKVSVLGNLPASKKTIDPKKKANRLNKKRKGVEADSELYLQENAVQAYEILCTNILFAQVFEDSRKSLLITGPEKLSEQAQISLNLAIAAVSFEQAVLLVDANTRHPELHKLLEIENGPGFHEIFYGSGYISLDDKVHETAVPNLHLMTAGEASADSQKLTVLRPGTQHIYGLPNHMLPGDFVIFNCDSILNDKIGRLLTSHTTATVLLCELKRTRGQELKAAIEVVERLKGTVLGVITVEPPKRSPFALLKLNGRKPKASAEGSNVSLSETEAVHDDAVI